MAKVDFKLNDSLIRRRKEARTGHPAALHDAGDAVSEPPPIVGRFGPDVASFSVQAEETRSNELPLEAPARYDGRRFSVQTSVLLPPTVWERLDQLARGAGGLASPNQLLVDILAEGPHSVHEAASELEQFLALPSEETHVGEPWEERNLRLPLAVRQRVDECRSALREAGIRHATRAHLVAAAVCIHGPKTSDDARAMMAERRAEAFRRALTPAT